MASKARSSKKSYSKRRSYKKKQQTTISVTKALTPIPSRYITRMKYAEAVPMSSAGMSTYRWNLNSIWDPNRTGIGHQPYAYDQLSTLYNRYRVISCRYVVSAIADGSNIQCAVLPSNDASPPISNVSECRENPRAQYIVQNPGGNLKVMKGKVNLPQLMGRTTEQYMASDKYEAIVTSSPTEIGILHVFTQGFNDDPTFNPNATINILLEYTVEFFDPFNQEQS